VDAAVVKEKRDKVLKGKKFRCNRAEDILLEKVLSDSDMTFQSFVDACVQALLRADPNMLKVLKDFKILKEVPKEVLGEFILSQRERTTLLEEFEKKGSV
jgi:hypothetical protein